MSRLAINVNGRIFAFDIGEEGVEMTRQGVIEEAAYSQDQTGDWQENVHLH